MSDTSILYDQIGPYILTVNTQNKVLLKRVTLGPKFQGRQGILKGLEKNDRVVVDGIQNAIPGNQVELIHKTEAANK